MGSCACCQNKQEEAENTKEALVGRLVDPKQIPYHKGSRSIQLQPVKKTADKSIIVNDGNIEEQKLKNKLLESEKTIQRLNSIIKRQEQVAKEQALQKIRMRQQLENAKNKSIIRAARNQQELALANKQNQLQRQKDQQKQKLLRQAQKLIKQRQKTIDNIKNFYQNKIGQIKRQEQTHFSKIKDLKDQLQAKERQIEAIKLKLQEQSSKAKLSQTKLIDCMKKLQSYQLELSKIQNQLEKERQSSLVKSKKIEQIRFNELFQNDIFADRNHLKMYLTSCLEERYNRTVTRTKLLYAFDPNNRLNFHKSIDQKPNIVVIARLANGYYLAGFTQSPFKPKTSSDGDALLISLTNQRIFYLVEENSKGITYDDYYIIFGNSEFRIRSMESKIFSNFGISNGFFASRGETINTLFGEGNSREVELVHYEVYQVFFQYL